MRFDWLCTSAEFAKIVYGWTKPGPTSMPVVIPNQLWNLCKLQLFYWENNC